MSSAASKQIHVETPYDKFDLNGYTCELSATAFVPPRRTQEKQRNFFNAHHEVVLTMFIFCIGNLFFCLVDKTFVDL